MATSKKEFYYDLDLVKNSLLNARLNPMTTVERLTLSLGLDHNGYVAWDNTLKGLFIWDGVEWISSSSGSFLSLEDTPDAYTDAASKVVRVDSTESFLEFHTLTKSDLGLSNVDNTSDLNKPISTATQTALDLKANKSISIIALGNGITGGGSLIQNRSFSLDFTYLDSRYTGFDETYTKSEIDDFFSGVDFISGYNKTNWDSAYSWGNHASAGYITSEVDTLATVTSRGSTTSTAVTFNAGFTASSGAVNGTLTISPSSDATLVLRANSSSNTARILFNNGASSIWAFYKDSTVSDLRLYNYTTSSFAFNVNVLNNAVTFTNTITASSIIKSGGTGLQFLKADGTVDNNVYLTTSDASLTYIEKSRYIVDEIPSGVIDGVNNIFIITNVPITGKLMFFINGLKMEAGALSDYTITSNTITINPGAIPRPGDKLSVTYIY